MNRSLTPLLALGLTLGTASAATLSTGSATFDYDPAAWATVAGGANAPGFQALVLDEYFDAAAAAARTGAQIQSDEIVLNPATTGLISTMNGATVTNLAGRTAQPTTFAFEPGALTSHTGVIGLGGVTRWEVNALIGGGKVLSGDYTLAYDVSRQLAGGSGWALTNNILPALVVFDLTGVTATGTASSLTISGSLALSPEVATLLLQTPANAGKDMGDFSFSATVVPEPSGALLGGLALVCGILRRRR